MLCWLELELLYGRPKELESSTMVEFHLTPDIDMVEAKYRSVDYRSMSSDVRHLPLLICCSQLVKNVELTIKETSKWAVQIEVVAYVIRVCL